MKTSLVDDDAGLCELADDWTHLAERSLTATAFQTFEWVASWWRSFGSGKHLAVVTVRQGNELVGIAPLAISRWEAFRHLGFLGSGLADYEDFLIADGVDRGQVLAAIAATVESLDSWDFFLTNRMRDDSPNLAASLTAFVEASARLRPFGIAPYVAIAGSWEEYERSLPKGVRSDSRRQKKRLLAQHGEINFVRPQTESEKDVFVDELIAMHRERRTQVKGDYSLFEQQPIVDFYRRLVAGSSRSRLLELEALEVDGRPVALHLGLRYKQRFYYLLPAMGRDLAAYSPGRLLLLHLLEESFGRGDLEFDLLLGDEAYKAEFATNRRRLMTLDLYRETVAGRAARTWFGHARPWLARSLGAEGSRWLRNRGVLGRFS